MNNDEEFHNAIDVTQWIGQSYFKAYPHSLNRTGIHEKNGRIFCATQFAFDELYHKPEGKPILNASQLSAAEFFATLYEVATRKTGYGQMRALMNEWGGSDKIPGFCAHTLFKLIENEMQKWQYAMCERLCLQPLRTNDWGWIVHYSYRVQESFDSLGAAIEKAVDILKKRLEDANNYEGQTALKNNQPA